jgi:hypothetical protein
MASFLIQELNQSPVEKMTTLSVKEQKIIAGGASCTYAGQSYSPGSTVKMEGGEVKLCTLEGKWV